MDTILLRFNEAQDEVLPSDTSGQLEDLNIEAPSTMPPVVDAFTGYGREFSADDMTALQAVDRDDGNTLLTRTMSVQTILKWDLAGQADAGVPGCVIARGKPVASASLAPDGGLYLPADAAEWTDLLDGTGIANPDSLWTFQQSSGDVVDEIGSRDLVAAGTPTYQQSVPGFTRKAISFDDGSTDRFSTTIPSGATGYVSLVIARMRSAPAATRSIVEHPNIYSQVTAGLLVRGDCASAASGAISLGSDVHVIITKSSDALSEARVLTDDELISPNYGLFAGTTLTVGGSSPGDTPPMDVLYMTAWEADLTDAQLSTILDRIENGSGATATADPIAFGLELRVVNEATRVGEVRLIWQDIDGNDHVTTGPWFVAPENTSAFLMITATRRWVSSSEVVCRYYIGGQMLGEFVESGGDIGGNTLGTTTVGARYDAGAWANWFCGSIDEIRVVDYELSGEEIEATWLRISEYQEMGVSLYIEQHPPGWPVTFDSGTRSGKEAGLYGRALGYAAAQIENFRANMMPDRAYGRVLDRWENIVGVEARHGDSVEARRARVLSRMRQRAGVSPPGVRIALEELLDIDRDDIDVIAFSNRIEDDFDELHDQRWQTNPPAKWSIVGGQLQVSTNDSAAEFGDNTWRTCITGVDGPSRIGGYGAQLFAKVTPTTRPDGGEVGIMLFDKARRDAILLGVRRIGADYYVFRQTYVSGVSVNETSLALTSNTPHWFHLGAEPLDYTDEEQGDQVDHFVRWSTTSAVDGFTEAAASASFSFGWCGFFARGFDGGAGINGDTLTCTFDDAVMLFPHGSRPFYFYAMRDADAPGEYDLTSASATLAKLKQAHTHACAISSLDVLCDDPDSGCGLGPCGGI